MQTMWTNYNSTNPGKLHIVAANTQSESAELLNSTTWRSRFSPALTYFIATKSMLGHTYAQFGNGYVPMNVIIGGGNRVLFSSSSMPSTAVVDQAIASLDNFVSLTAAVPNQEISVGEQLAIDLKPVCTASDGSAILSTIQSITDTELISAIITNDTLKITANQRTGTVKIRIKATKGELFGFYEVAVKIVNNSIVQLLAINFDNFPPAGWTNIGWMKGNGGVVGSCALATFQPAGTKLLTTPQIKLPDSAAVTLSFDWKNNDISKIVNHDSTFCEITNNDGANWVQLAVLSASSPQTSFSHVSKSLEDYRGQNIKLRWRYKTNASSSAYGSGIDEVQLTYAAVGISSAIETASCALYQNYPNPFNPSTVISYQLNKSGFIKLVVYNAKGEFVKTIENGLKIKGLHQATFDGSNLNSGIYYYTLSLNDQTKSGKMLLVK